MDKNELKKLRDMAIGYMRRRRYPDELAEDFAQFYLLKVLVEDRKASMEQLAIDFLRSEYGSYRTAVGRLRSQNRRRDYGNRVDDSGKFWDFDSTAYNLSTEESLEDEALESVVTSVDLAPFLSRRDLIILELINRGFKQCEVSEVLSLTQGRVSQILKALRSKVGDLEEVCEFYDEYRREPARSVIGLHWIVL